MSDPAEPRFRWGQPVQAAIDLVNDGSYPNWPEQALIVASGDRGEIVQIGAHVESSTTIYLVEFSDNRVVGCLEDEIAEVSAAAAVTPTESQSP